MKKLSTKVLLLAAFAFVSISAVGQSKAELKQMIEKNNKGMIDAVLADDVEKAIAFYDKDIIQLPANAKIIRGVDEVRKDIEANRKEGWRVKEYKINTDDVELNGDVITEIGTYSMSVGKEGDSKTHKYEGKYLTQWEKQTDGSYKLKTEIWNHDSENNSMASDSSQDMIEDPDNDSKKDASTDKKAEKR